MDGWHSALVRGEVGEARKAVYYQYLNHRVQHSVLIDDSVIILGWERVALRCC